jgi:hypothetical protein
VRRGITILAGAALLMVPAVYNGYPLTFWDTRAYVEHSGTLWPRPDRLIGYSLWLRALGWGLTLWPAAIAQCAVVAWLVWRVLRVVAPSLGARGYLALMLALTVGTALPWVAGQIMADVFTPVMVLAIFLLVSEADCSRLERGLLLALLALCAAVHLTHVPIALGVLAVAWLVLRWRRDSRALARVAMLGLAVLLGLAGMLGFNWTRTGRATLAAGSDAFLFGHLVDSGIARRMLDEHCPERDYWLCPFREQIPMSTDELLWADKLGLAPWQHPEQVSREAKRLLHDSLREHPGLHLKVALRYTGLGLTRFRTGEGLDGDARELIEAQIARHARADLHAFRSSRQQASALPVDHLRALHTPIGWLALAGSLILLLMAAAAVRGTSLQDPSLCLLLFSAAAYLLNGVLSANLSGLYDRYESRLIWLFVLGLWAFAARRAKLVVAWRAS